MQAIDKFMQSNHTLAKSNLYKALLFICILTLAAGCNMPAKVSTGSTTPPASGSATSLQPQPETLVSFRVVAPANTPPGEQVFLTILDEVTGLALNPEVIPMEVGALGPPAITPGARTPTPPAAYPANDNSSEETQLGSVPEGESPGQASQNVYVFTLQFPIGSIIQYRYERSAGAVRVAEHLSDGSAVRYRMLHVTGQMLVDDVISRWTDTAYAQPSGRIAGKAVDAVSGAPIPSLLVSAGGAQTITASDGSFLLEGLPPGVHNLVAYAMDGAYLTFQQGAKVAADSTTPTPLKLEPSKFTSVVFVVKPPQSTFSVVPLRLAGNLYQLGDTFANLALGASILPANMPLMERLPDGRYKLTISLPVGADIHYKYTLGDGYWNAERNTDGTIRTRHFIVPDKTVLIDDTVDTWSDVPGKQVTFDITAPANTPAGDFVSIQFNPIIGWTEPIPMWNLGNGRWAYILYSPLAFPGDLTYRYCRNGQCNYALDAAGERKITALAGSLNSLSSNDNTNSSKEGESKTGELLRSEKIDGWVGWNGVPAITLPAVEAQPRESGFLAGIELLPSLHPSWHALFNGALKDIQATKANLVVLRPTWSFGRAAPGNNPPILSAQPERDATWFALTDMLSKVKGAGMQSALYPDANFLAPWDQWWISAPRDDPGWWPVFWDQYRTFVLHHADLAAQSGAQALILGGDWLAPALPGGTLPDGQPSGAPDGVEAQWQSLIKEARGRFSGKLVWAIDAYSLDKPPAFLDAFDEVYVTLTLPPGKGYADVLDTDLESWLDDTLHPFQYNADKPLLLGLGLPSDPDMGTQMGLYQRALTAVADRDWISGVIARGYYPAVEMQDGTASVNGKPAAALLAKWFGALLGK